MDALDFVRGSVATSNLVPQYQFIVARDGFLAATNGITTAVAKDSFTKDVNACVRGSDFVKAVKANGLESFSMAKKRVKSSKNVTVFIDTTDDLSVALPQIKKRQAIDKSFIDALKTVVPFVSVDGSLSWAAGVRYSDGKLFSTNGFTAVEHSCMCIDCEDITLPTSCVYELLRIKACPVEIGFCDDAIVFIYENGWRLYSRLLDTAWQDMATYIEQHDFKKCKAVKDLFKSIKSVVPFLTVDNRIFLSKGLVSTTDTKNTGATCNTNMYSAKGVFNFVQLSLLESVASKIDFSFYPAVVPFTGDNIRGLIAGMVN